MCNNPDHQWKEDEGWLSEFCENRSFPGMSAYESAVQHLRHAHGHIGHAQGLIDANAYPFAQVPIPEQEVIAAELQELERQYREIFFRIQRRFAEYMVNSLPN